MNVTRLILITLTASTGVGIAGVSRAQLYINGSLHPTPTTESGVPAPEGANWSEIQHDEGATDVSNGVAGYSSNPASDPPVRIVDDFSVPAGQTWIVTHVVLFAYQVDYTGTASPFLEYTLRVWDAPPPDGHVLCGDATTNVLVDSSSTGIYRVLNTVVPAPGVPATPNRPVWRNTLRLPADCPGDGTFPAGTYWLDWSSSTGAAHFHPSKVVPGARGAAGDNALQYYDHDTPPVVGAVVDRGLPADAADVAQDFPFQLLGTIEGQIFRDGFETPASQP